MREIIVGLLAVVAVLTLHRQKVLATRVAVIGDTLDDVAIEVAKGCCRGRN